MLKSCQHKDSEVWINFNRNHMLSSINNTKTHCRKMMSLNLYAMQSSVCACGTVRWLAASKCASWIFGFRQKMTMCLQAWASFANLTAKLYCRGLYMQYNCNTRKNFCRKLAIRSADELTERSDKKLFKMYPLSSLRTTVTGSLQCSLSYDVSKRPHYIRPTSCVIKYTGSQSSNPLLFCEMFLL